MTSIEVFHAGPSFQKAGNSAGLPTSNLVIGQLANSFTWKRAIMERSVSGEM